MHPSPRGAEFEVSRNGANPSVKTGLLPGPPRADRPDVAEERAPPRRIAAVGLTIVKRSSLYADAGWSRVLGIKRQSGPRLITRFAPAQRRRSAVPAVRRQAARNDSQRHRIRARSSGSSQRTAWGARPGLAGAGWNSARRRRGHNLIKQLCCVSGEAPRAAGLPPGCSRFGPASGSIFRGSRARFRYRRPGRSSPNLTGPRTPTSSQAYAPSRARRPRRPHRRVDFSPRCWLEGEAGPACSAQGRQGRGDFLVLLVRGAGRCCQPRNFSARSTSRARPPPRPAFHRAISEAQPGGRWYLAIFQRSWIAEQP